MRLFNEMNRLEEFYKTQKNYDILFCANQVFVEKSNYFLHFKRLYKNHNNSIVKYFQ